MHPQFAAASAAMPATVRELLVAHRAPETVDPSALLQELCLPQPAYRAARRGQNETLAAAVLQKRAILSQTSCRSLRAAVDQGKTAHGDSVDGLSDHQLNLTTERLGELIGAVAVAELHNLAAQFAAQKGVDACLVVREAFARRYSLDTRPWIPFHCDRASVTVNVALNGESEHTGGRLLVLCGDQVRWLASREEGEATVHGGSLLHAVSRMEEGVRYSLIVFYSVVTRYEPKP